MRAHAMTHLWRSEDNFQESLATPEIKLKSQAAAAAAFNPWVICVALITSFTVTTLTSGTCDRKQGGVKSTPQNFKCCEGKLFRERFRNDLLLISLRADNNFRFWASLLP